MSIVEYERMSERLCFNVKSFLARKHVKNFLIDLICLYEVIFKGFLDVRMGCEHCFRAKRFIKGKGIFHTDSIGVINMVH